MSEGRSEEFFRSENWQQEKRSALRRWLLYETARKVLNEEMTEEKRRSIISELSDESQTVDFIKIADEIDVSEGDFRIYLERNKARND